MTAALDEPPAAASRLCDAHLDLAMNALEWNRDLTRPIAEIRAREDGQTDRPDRTRGTVCFPEMQRGGVRLCVATQIARVVAPRSRLPGWGSQEQAWAHTQGQLAWYREMEGRGELVQIRDRAGLQRHAEAGADRGPIGYVLSLEGADSLVTLDHLTRAWAYGLRAVGPAHYGPGVYAQGTTASGGFTARGRDLLREMDRLGMILDVTHLTDEEFWEAIDTYRGPVWASHSNCRAITPHQRQLDDDQIRALASRDGLIGAAFDAWMLVPGWERGSSDPAARGVSLATVADHVDHVCQVVGSPAHVMIGSDLDGGFGREQSPSDLETIADLPRLLAALQARGYGDAGITDFAWGNAVRFLSRALPTAS